MPTMIRQADLFRLPKNRTIYFDMDGTLADLYGVPKRNFGGSPMGVFQRLDNNDARVYAEARPIMANVNLLKELKRKGYRIGIITAGSRFPPGTPPQIQQQMNNDTLNAKRRWLNRYGIFVDEFKFTPYGVPKINSASDRQGVLIDDEDKVLRTWPGMAVKANPVNRARF